MVPYFQVDAFADRVFAGNPAGVCVLAEFFPDAVMQAMAAENHLAETAFAVRRAGRYDLRWFAPAAEVDLCGHATLAAAHVLWHHLGETADALRFDTRSGELVVTRDGDRLALDLPSRPPVECAPPADLIAGLGATPQWVGKSRDYVAVFGSEAGVLALRPDMAALCRLDALGVIATAPGADGDFASRCFFPSVGVPEDPVTGSAHCTLVPYWAARLGRTTLEARQVSKRGGRLWCEELGSRVKVAGRAVTYMTGFVRPPICG